MLSKFLRKQEGISAIEYALIAILVAIAIIAGATTLGIAIGDKFTEEAEMVDSLN